MGCILITSKYQTVPTFKEKGSRLDYNNYRPISLLSNINKIIEMLMYSRFYKFLTTYNCMYELQFGFRANHSTSHASISLREDIRDALDNNAYAGGIFIDLQKAFDTVDHDILFRKLDHYCIIRTAKDWFNSYLARRRQFVSINGINSTEEVIKFGVPQRSVQIY